MARLRRSSELSQQDPSSAAWAFGTTEMRSDRISGAVAAEGAPEVAVFEPLGLMCAAWAPTVVESRSQPALHGACEQ